MKKIRRALAKQDGVPVPIGIMAKGRDNRQCRILTVTDKIW
jgi:hypothetical protein